MVSWGESSWSPQAIIGLWSVNGLCDKDPCEMLLCCSVSPQCVEATESLMEQSHGTTWWFAELAAFPGSCCHISACPWGRRLQSQSVVFEDIRACYMQISIRSGCKFNRNSYYSQGHVVGKLPDPFELLRCDMSASPVKSQNFWTCRNKKIRWRWGGRSKFVGILAIMHHWQGHNTFLTVSICQWFSPSGKHHVAQCDWP